MVCVTTKSVGFIISCRYSCHTERYTVVVCTVLHHFVFSVGTADCHKCTKLQFMYALMATCGRRRRRLYVSGSSVRAAVRASVRDSRGSFMFPRYLQYLLTDFRQTFVTGASRDRDDLITFLGQKVKVQGHTIAAEAHSTRRYRRVQLFLVLMYIL